MRVEYYSPNGEGPITFGYDLPYGIVKIENIGNNLANPVLARGPAQRGATLRDVEVSERVIPVSVDVIEPTGNMAAYWALRSALDRALVVEPGSFGSPPPLGLLRFLRDEGLPILQLPALPRNSPQYGEEGPAWVAADIEFVAPYPFPMETEDRVFNVAGSGGFEFTDPLGLEMPSGVGFEMPSYNVTVDVPNGGDVYAPVLIRMYGNVTDPVLYNDTTGERITYVGSIAATEYVEINTEYGNKYAEKVIIATGVRTNVMSAINFTVSKLWALKPGLNTIRFAASINVSGYANVYWRQRFGGL